MKKTLNSTQIILRILCILWLITAIVLAIVMGKCTLRDGSNLCEFFMGLHAMGCAVVAIICSGLSLSYSGRDRYLLMIYTVSIFLAIYVVIIFFGLEYNSKYSCNIYNETIITAVIETVISIALLGLLFFKKPKTIDENAPVSDGTHDEDEDAPDGHTTISV